jgi:short subunit dehydrogenase-like uncharacterized protein
MANREFDLILYGASGYTARYVIKELDSMSIKIAVSARDINKIQDTSLTKIKCSLDEIESLTRRTKILLNCVGPYAITGEQVIKSCIETGTHYLDICGETPFISEIFKKYHLIAKEKGVRIIQSCGFDSLPADLGACLVGKFDDIREVDVVHVLHDCKINVTTWRSLLLSLIKNDKKKNKLNYKPVPSKQDNKPSQSTRKKTSEYRYNNDLKSYDVKFRGTDPYIINRSCEYFRLKNIYDIKFNCFLNIGGLFALFRYFLMCFLGIFAIKSKFFFDLINKYPRFFTCGHVVENPSLKDTEKSKFMVILKGKSTKGAGDRILTISGIDPGYRSTAIFLTQSACSILEEIEKVPCGIHTPAVAFHNTRIVDRLVSKGIKFTYSDQK